APPPPRAPPPPPPAPPPPPRPPLPPPPRHGFFEGAMVGPEGLRVRVDGGGECGHGSWAVSVSVGRCLPATVGRCVGSGSHSPRRRGKNRPMTRAPHHPGDGPGGSAVCGGTSW